MAPTVLEILQQSEVRLNGVDSPRLSTEVLVAEVLGCSRLSLVLDRDRLLSADEMYRIDELITRREKGEPIAYILGSKEFYGLDFKVTPDTLIPRPETEHIIEKAEEWYQKDASIRFADLGTGSGIIAVTLAHLFPKWTGIAVDLSVGALQTAKENAATHGVSGQLTFLEGNFTQPLFDDASFDLIVSNPPYVPQQEYCDASHEVTSFEPKTALVSGEDGLNHIRLMLPLVSKALVEGGKFLMEVGYQQARAIEAMVPHLAADFVGFEVVKDLARHDRIVCLTK
jgi:release factor glutamine methyltransferase